jgi:hypothetical protein
VKRREAFGRVIESMQRRVSDAVEESKTLRAQLQETKALSTKQEKTLLELQAALETSVAEQHGLQAKLDTATATIAALSEVDVADPVSDAVDEAIKEIPDLEKHRDVLLRARDGEELTSLLESLVPALLVRAPETTQVTALHEAAPPKKRSTLPRGAVISEGIKATSDQKVQAKGMAAMAATVVSQVKSRAAPAAVS